jgi:hypothetical protein
METAIRPIASLIVGYFALGLRAAENGVSPCVPGQPGSLMWNGG